MKLYRYVSGGTGIFEAAKRDCSSTDFRRQTMPDGPWLTKVGAKFPRAVSFWTAIGKKKYEEGGLRDWHESVCKAPVEVLIGQKPKEIFYEDEFQVFRVPDSLRSVRIRPAKGGDEYGIAEVHVQAWNETYSGLMPADLLASRTVEDKAKQWQKSILSSSNPHAEQRLLVAEDFDGKIVGMCVGGKNRKSDLGYNFELYAIYLLKKFQGSGVGSLMFAELSRWLKLQGSQGFMLWVLEGNPTIRFYENMGGKFFGKKKEVDFGGRRCVELAYGWRL